MSIWILLVIMLATGIAGGMVNYLLPSNENEHGVKIKAYVHCVILGVGATLLVPLFLEIAQSNLLDNMHAQFSLRPKGCECPPEVKDVEASTDAKKNAKQSIDTIKAKIDSATVNDSTAATTASPKTKLTESKAETNVTPCGNCDLDLKTYFLFAAYCFLAAAAGTRFITGVTDSILKDKQLAEAKAAKLEAEKEKTQIEQKQAARQTLDRINQERLEQKLKSEPKLETFLPDLGPITNPEDPQKGRFGGSPVRNNRALKANVSKSKYPGFYDIKIWVESLDQTSPLSAPVIFYLHDSFNPSVYTIRVEEFTDNRAEDNLIAYGAFTVGAITDNGQTLLELDLAQNADYPKEFRDN